MNEADPSIDRTDTAANGPGSEPDPALELMAAGQPQAAASSSGSAENARTVDVADPAIAPAPVMPTSTARQIDLPAADLQPAEPAEPLASEAPPEPDVAAISPWTVPSAPGERVRFGFNLAKVIDAGEDSDPLLHEARDVGLVAVFDGMGGAGGTAYQTVDGPRTGAYLASRAARDAVELRMLDLLQTSRELDGPAVAAELHDAIEEALRDRLAALAAPRSMLRSKLLRALPTTMALAAVDRTGPVEGTWRCLLLWSGDSRVYLLQPDSGASQLTTDDIRDQGDAMANLRQDSVISNALSADTAFVVNHRRIELSEPFLLVAATDGCFGYLPSPMHFEWLLLSTLQNSTDTELWSARLQEYISAISGDDASMAVLGIGADHQQFQSLFADRTAALTTRWITPIDDLAAEIGALEERLDEVRRRHIEQTAELWAAYRPDYQLHLDAGHPAFRTSEMGAS